MWWAAGIERCRQVIQDRWRAGGIDAVKHLITGSGVKSGIRANADGDPAADGMQVSKTVGRCNVERETVFTVKRIFKE
jgi:hypothetical protein